MNIKHKNFTYICNWKQYFNRNQAYSWFSHNHNELINLTHREKLIFCPDFCSIEIIKNNFPSITLGAQNCSSYDHGAYTGEISAQSLQEIGAQYCIIGHSERRTLFHEKPAQTALKTIQLQQKSLTPIVCVSDNFHDELTPLLKHINPKKEIIVAYEPVTSIGTGIVPKSSDIKKQTLAIKTLIKKKSPDLIITLLYGGSVSSATIQSLKMIPSLEGFLIGKASTDFQELKKIVSFS